MDVYKLLTKIASESMHGYNLHASSKCQQRNSNPNFGIYFLSLSCSNITPSIPGTHALIEPSMRRGHSAVSVSDEDESAEIYSHLVMLLDVNEVTEKRKNKNIQQLGFAGGHPPNY